MKPGLIERGAYFPEPGMRAVLMRTWDSSKPRGLFVGLNPGKADDRADDATARKYRGFAQRWGWGAYWAVNLWEWVATYPDELWTRLLAGQACASVTADLTLLEAAAQCPAGVCLGTGNPPDRGPLREAFRLRREVLQTMLRKVPRVPVLVVGWTKLGYPKHLSRAPYGPPIEAHGARSLWSV